MIRTSKLGMAAAALAMGASVLATIPAEAGQRTGTWRHYQPGGYGHGWGGNPGWRQGGYGYRPAYGYTRPRYRNNAGAAIAAGVIGALAVGALAASAAPAPAYGGYGYDGYAYAPPPPAPPYAYGYSAGYNCRFVQQPYFDAYNNRQWQSVQVCD